MTPRVIYIKILDIFLFILKHLFHGFQFIYVYSKLVHIVLYGLSLSYLLLSYINLLVTFLSFLDIDAQVGSDPPASQQ